MMALARQDLKIGAGNTARQIAMLVRQSHPDAVGPGLFWLGGFKSAMTGLKAECLDTMGAEHELCVTRFDYSGHGQSGGDFLDGTISRWLEEAIAVFATTSGPQIVIGSSMGGWLALLLARALRQSDPGRVAGLVLIAPAVDMTETLMKPSFTAAQWAELKTDGQVTRPSAYGDGPYILTQSLLQDGAKHLLLGHANGTGSIITDCPVHILQGGRDPDVPQAIAERLLAHLTKDPATLSLVPDGDHRLSRPSDLELLTRAVMAQVTRFAGS